MLVITTPTEGETVSRVASGDTLYAATGLVTVVYCSRCSEGIGGLGGLAYPLNELEKCSNTLMDEDKFDSDVNKLVCTQVVDKNAVSLWV